MKSSAFHPGSSACFLHHLSLNQLSSLSGITTVYNPSAFALNFDYCRALLYQVGWWVWFGKRGVNHHEGELDKYAFHDIFMWLLQGTRYPKCPGHLVSVSLYPSFCFCSQYIGDTACNGRFFGNTNYHNFLVLSNRIAKVAKTSKKSNILVNLWEFRNCFQPLFVLWYAI